jgi:Aminotransferase class I and II
MSRSSRATARSMSRATRSVCVDPTRLPQTLAGRSFDRELQADASPILSALVSRVGTGHGARSVPQARRSVCSRRESRLPASLLGDDSTRDARSFAATLPIGRVVGPADVAALAVPRHEVKLVSVQTGSQNPTGQDMSPERAERLLALARAMSFFIMEDGVYSTVRFGTRSRPASRLRAPDHSVYVVSLSKTVGGGLRVGWIAAHGEIRRRLTELKLASDHHTSLLPQHRAPVAGGRRPRSPRASDQRGPDASLTDVDAIGPAPPRR